MRALGGPGGEARPGGLRPWEVHRGRRESYRDRPGETYLERRGSYRARRESFALDRREGWTRRSAHGDGDGTLAAGGASCAVPDRVARAQDGRLPREPATEVGVTPDRRPEGLTTGVRPRNVLHRPTADDARRRTTDPTGSGGSGARSDGRGSPGGTERGELRQRSHRQKFAGSMSSGYVGAVASWWGRS